MKKLIAMGIAVTLIISSLSTAVFASEPDKKVIDDLYKYHILADTSDIRADDNITRAEAVKMLCMAEGNDLLNGIKPEVQIFSDVPTDHWAAKYIEIGYYDKIVQGYDDNTFRPDSNITQQELQKMIVSFLGFDLYAQNGGGYPAGYLSYAKALGFVKGINVENNELATRGDTMQMIYNALDCPLMEVQRMFEDNAEIDPIVKVYDGTGKYPFKSFRMVLNGEAEF